MVKKRPLGVTVVAGLLVLAGGLLLLIRIFEVVDSLRFFGFESVLISTPLALLGFVVYGAMPVLLYCTGIGLFMGRAWARKSVLWVLPVLLFLYIMNFAAKLAREKLHVASIPALELFLYTPGIFLDMFFRQLISILPIIIYFNNTHVQFFFLEDEE